MFNKNKGENINSVFILSPKLWVKFSIQVIPEIDHLQLTP